MSALAVPAEASRGPSRLSLAGEALAARGGLVLLAVALFVFLTVPLAMILVRSVEGRGGEFVGLANFITYVQTPALAQSTRNTLVFALLTTAVTVPLAFVLRLRDPAQLHSVQGPLAQHRDDSDPRAVAARCDLVHLPVRQPGRAQVHARRGSGLKYDLRHARHGAGDDVRIVPACGDDPDGGARRCPTRGCTRRPTHWAPASDASSSRSRCRAPSTA